MLSVVDLGAVGDGKTDCTKAFQEAFQWVSSGYGSKLHIPAGTYLTGPWNLPGNIDLHLAADAFVQFIPDFNRYLPVFTRWEGVDCHCCHPLVFAENKKNIRIHGKGILDGGGQAWWDAYLSLRSGKAAKDTDLIRGSLAGLNKASGTQPSGGGGRDLQFLRPPLLQFLGCEAVLVEGLTLQNSPFWNTHAVYSRDLEFSGVSFLNPSNAPNTDGLDIDSCKGVLIGDCVFDVGDDCLAVKAGAGSGSGHLTMSCENITIHDCVMRSGHGGIVIGSETAGGIRQVKARNCRMRNTDRGIRIKTRRGRGGMVEDLEFSNIDIASCKCPIVINSYYRCGADPEDPILFSLLARKVDSGTPRIRAVRIQDLKAVDCKSSAGFMVGLPEAPIQGLILERCTIEMSAPEHLIDPSESAMYAGLPAAASRGIRLEFVDGVEFHDVRLDGVALADSRMTVPV